MGFLLPSVPDTVTEGPRLDSRKVTDSAYGNMIPQAHGTARLAGDVIWATEIEEERVEESQQVGGKGGGGGTATNVTYLYYANFAVAFSETVASELFTLWADTKLLYNKNVNVSQATREGVVFRFYRGTEDQIPDPLIVADKGSNAPAFRGLCYAVFERMPLKDFGNRLPPITANINFEFTGNGSVTTEASNPVSAPATSLTKAVVDWGRNKLFLPGDTFQTTTVLNTNTLEQVALISNSVANGYEHIDLSTGTLIANGTDPESGDPALFRVSPYTGSIVYARANDAETPSDPPILLGTETFGYRGGTIWLRSVGGTLRHSIFERSDEVGKGWIVRTGTTLELVDDFDDPNISGFFFYYHFANGAPGSGVGYYGSCAQSQIRIVRHTIQGEKVFYPLAFTIAPTEIDATATQFLGGTGPTFPNGTHLHWDATSGDLLFLAHVDTPSGAKIYGVRMDTTNGSVVWATLVPVANLSNDTATQSQIAGGRWAYYSGQAIVSLNVASGKLDPVYNGVNTFGPLGGEINWYDDRTGRIFCMVTDNGTIARAHTVGGTVPVPVPIADVIDRVSEQAGLQILADVDTRDLGSTTVEGYVIDKRTTAKSIIEPLSKFGFFDLVERDGKLTYVNRGAATVATITEDEFVRDSDSRVEQYEEIRAQEVELPTTINVDFVDIDSDYQPNSVTTKRILAPFSAVKNESSEVFKLPFIIDPDEAKQTAEKALYTAWLERTNYEFRLGWTYLYLEPTDNIEVSLNNGLTFDARMRSLDVGLDYTIECKLAKQGAGQYDSTTTADGGTINPPVLTPIQPSQFFVADSTLIADVYDTRGNGSAAFWFASPYTDGTTWPGARLFRSIDGSDWAEIDQQLDEVPWGIVTTVIPDAGDDIWRISKTDSFTVDMVIGGDQLGTVTELQMLNGSNAALILKSNGEVELLQFQNVTDNGDGTYTMDTLLRGRRGSDTMTDNHTADDQFFILLSEAVIGVFSQTISVVNTEADYRAVTAGQVFEQSIVERKTLTGRDIKPYAVVNHTATDAGGGDVDLAWVRRTRLGGALVDGIGTVPLNEESEEYELEIFDGPAGSVVRTITGLSSPDYTYLSADRTTDGLAAATELTIKAYQISAQIGRGFSNEVTIEIV